MACEIIILAVSLGRVFLRHSSSTDLLLGFILQASLLANTPMSLLVVFVLRTAHRFTGETSLKKENNKNIAFLHGYGRREWISSVFRVAFLTFSIRLAKMWRMWMWMGVGAGIGEGSRGEVIELRVGKRARTAGRGRLARQGD